MLVVGTGLFYEAPTLAGQALLRGNGIGDGETLNAAFKRRLLCKGKGCTDDRDDEMRDDDDLLDDAEADLPDDPPMGHSSWLLGLFSAITMKMTASIDDIVWLAPFLAVPRSRVAKHVLVYMWVCMFMGVLALAMSRAGVAGLNAMSSSSSGWSSEKLLTVASGTSLMIYGIYLACEYAQERATEVEEAEEQEILVSKFGATYTEQNFKKSPKSPDKLTPMNLFVMSFLGNLDDLTLFLPMLLGKAIDWSQLILGVLISSMAMVTLCLSMTLLKPVTYFFRQIPLWAIVVLFAAFLIVKGLTMG